MYIENIEPMLAFLISRIIKAVVEKIVGDSEIYLTACFLALFRPTCWSKGLFQWL